VKSSMLLRIASVPSLIFCAGHTYGAFGTATTRDPGEAAVLMAMQSYRLGAPASASDFAARLIGLSLFRGGKFGYTEITDACQYAPHCEGA
jgi:hypothetical protein